MTPTTLAVIGDVHAHWPRLDPVLARIREVSDVRGVLLVGDLGAEPPWRTRRGSPEAIAARLESIAEVLDRVEALGLPVAWVPGNHDPRAFPPELDARGNVDGRLADVAGLAVTGIGGAGPARFGFPYEWDEDDVRALDLPAGADIIISHTPPAGTALALTHRGADAGSVAVRERAEAHAGALVCGHIHESPGAEVIGACLCVNAGGLGAPRGLAQVVFLTRDAAGWGARWEDLERGGTRSWRMPVT